jgi:hypothetical protein
MKSYTKTYLNYFGYALDDFIPCEICGNRGVDIHHIDCKGMGGSRLKDDIENIMALCREHHIEYGDKKQYIDFLKDIHNQRLKNK